MARTRNDHPRPGKMPNDDRPGPRFGYPRGNNGSVRGQPEDACGFNHLPRCTILDIATLTMELTRLRYWKAMDSAKFVKFVKMNLSGNVWMCLDREVMHREMDDTVGHLLDIVQRGVEESTPWARPSAYTV